MSAGHYRFGYFEAITMFALAVALLVALMATELRVLVPGDTSRDFSMLYVTAGRARAGLPLYVQTDPDLPGPLLNFNPPHLHLLLTPLTMFPLRTAYVIWSAVSLALLWAVLQISVGESRKRLKGAQWILMAGGLLASVGAAASLRMGQVSMLLALLATIAWRAARRGNWTSAGVWLGLAISLKPFLLLGLPALLLRGRWRAVAIAGIVAIVAIAAGALWLGWSAVSGWLEVFTSPRRATTFPFNAALAAVFARAGAPDLYGLVAAAAVALLTLWRVQHVDEDTAWALWLAASLLCSPLGWVYYLPMLIGPVFVLAMAGRIPHWAWWLAPAFLPPPLSLAAFQQSRTLAVTAGSVYCWALLACWIALYLVQQPARKVVHGVAACGQ